MAKKRKAAGRSAGPKGPKEVDAADARLGPISTYEDVADSEDEYFIHKDRIMLEDEPDSKRRKHLDEDVELSDEEVLGYEDSQSENDHVDDDDDDDDDDNNQEEPAPRSKSKKTFKRNNDDEDGEKIPAEDDPGWWGSSKQEYYDADNIETEADALEEEAEAKRLQQKKLSKMREEDFVFDGDEWLTAEPEAGQDEPDVVEVLKDVEVTSDMTPDERSRLLSTRYPEFDHLARELRQLQPVLLGLREAAPRESGRSIQTVKYWVLGCYVATLASYFAILASPARDAGKIRKALSPADLRDHDVMEALLRCREAWDRVKNLTAANNIDETTVSPAAETDGEQVPGESLAQLDQRTKKPKPEPKKPTAGKDKAAAAKQAKRLQTAKAVESSIADLYDLPLSLKASKKSTKAVAVAVADEGKDGHHSDFGEEEALDARAAADKAARKKTLKFYTSQIAQKANKRAGAGRDAGGDVDIPHRERLRDRRARLLAEAEKRGKRDSKHGADLGEESGGDEVATADAMRGQEDEYYDMVAHKSKSKREDKAARHAAYAAASKADRVVETEQVGEDGKRRITYAIEKNKGLAPKRSKDVRNPRVKRRKQYEAKKKKLKSMKPVWVGGEPKGGYKGESSGINTSVVKSIKL
ncbi:uncharacterized protein UV8b_06549 [Ustilaginoidea virens]|uniref:Sas10 C-terminal domain-containing protein n=1 Tax=Ustilaginoidea virens TaxID=1159556 RepID=A0A8E5MJ67_USTVR|nr:uncharacterized protein UV8b_06549 [Ustilaginoidea virens]QUC22308.1 hypothetical protein UV8b_06549 [Ustilaginoidea virens]